MSEPGGFGELLAGRVQERQSQIVLGIDPDPSKLWPTVVEASGVAATAAAAVAAHCLALIDAAGPACVAVKPQLACFERLGAPGREALGPPGGRIAGAPRSAQDSGGPSAAAPRSRLRARRQRRISSWWPERSTSGTVHPRYSAGRV